MDRSNSKCQRPIDIEDLCEQKYHKIPSEISLCLDLSSRSLKEVPKFSSESNCLQFLYLQGNLLQKLPHNFFRNLPFLRHLDLRHNELLEIPVSVAGHSSLEVLLLQDNQLSLLPCELGQVPRLRKLQFSGNPLSWPPKNILAQGLGAILSFLRSAFMEQLSRGDLDDIPKASSYDLLRSRSSEEINYEFAQVPMKKKAMDGLILLKVKLRGQRCATQSLFLSRILIIKMSLNKMPLLHLIFTLQGQPKQLKYRANSTGSKVWPKELKGPSLKPYVSPEHAQAIMNGQSYPLGYKKRSSSPSRTKIYKTLLQKLWLNQLKSVLQSQESVLQKQRSSEALRQWRLDAMAITRSSVRHNWPGLSLYFVCAPTILSKVNMCFSEQSQNKSLENKGRSKPKPLLCARAVSLQEKIDQILKSFDEIKLSKTESNCRSGDNDPATRRKLLAEEMRRISQLQKTVQALRLSA
ncbi:hypothetical protein ONE63_010074 [Megalurothrips usitatus]|uniref:Leucine-rich repeat-containing protein 27 n=1 Tax=Megalurothrips usitatus TaxID=439358 RepID=A0AAV7XLE4_9NEOP|nr:hypothetical protein ONE63_010074 [Megalurothrips usitatus]